MSVLQKDHDIDFEAAKFNDTCVVDGIGSGTDVKGTVVNNGISKEQEVSNLSESSVDLESGVIEMSACLVKTERDCRICHLSLGNQEYGIPIELGCSCKDDLAAAHKHCAEAWFKIKGNRTCEICGSIAQNVAAVPESELAVQWSEASDAPTMVAARVPISESRNSWKGHRFLNFLLACVVFAFAFALSWLFHFNILHMQTVDY